MFSLLVQVFFNPEPNHFLDQLQGEGLGEGEPDGALTCFEFSQFFFEGFNGGCGGVKAYVVLERGKINQNAPIELEGRHLVADCFFGVGRCFPDGLPKLL